MKKELTILKENPELDIHLEQQRATLKKVQNRKTPGHNSIHGFWLINFTSIHDRLAVQLNKCLEETGILELMMKGKTTLV